MSAERADQIRVVFRDEMCPPEDSITKSYSKSPSKPRLFVEKLNQVDDLSSFSIDGDFSPISDELLSLAHSPEYIRAFFAGEEPICSTNGIPWSPEFAESVRYTNASFVHALECAIQNPKQVVFSPVSGFHHAQPERGMGYCTFSGEVIGALNAFHKFGARGTFFDLDGHFGNSIEDSRDFAPLLNKAVPKGFNINPAGIEEAYLSDLAAKLEHVENAVLKGQIDYVVFCHGADSHEDDDMWGQCSTEAWLACSEMFYEWIGVLDEKLGSPIPLVLCLYGGYRPDDYNSVLDLHLADTAICLKYLTHRELSAPLNLLSKDKPRDNGLEK